MAMIVTPLMYPMSTLTVHTIHHVPPPCASGGRGKGLPGVISGAATSPAPQPAVFIRGTSTPSTLPSTRCMWTPSGVCETERSGLLSGLH